MHESSLKHANFVYKRMSLLARLYGTWILFDNIGFRTREIYGNTSLNTIRGKRNWEYHSIDKVAKIQRYNVLR